MQHKDNAVEIDRFGAACSVRPTSCVFPREFSCWDAQAARGVWLQAVLGGTSLPLEISGACQRDTIGFPSSVLNGTEGILI
mgnify:FL=1|jgi:hypothetical protein